jgi:uncharacterized protein
MTTVAGFDWDSGNSAKCRKHGVLPEDIEFALMHDPLVAPDVKHSRSEDRLIAIGKSRTGRVLFIAFTIRDRAGARLIRPISARYMHKKEIKAYEARSQTQD